MDLPIWNLTRTHKYTDTDHPSFAIKISYLGRMRRKNYNAKKNEQRTKIMRNGFKRTVFRRHLFFYCLSSKLFDFVFNSIFFLRIFYRQLFSSNFCSGLYDVASFRTKYTHRM